METVGYASPASLEEALELRERHGDKCRVLAGGTDLLVRAKVTGQWPSFFVDAKRIPELTRIVVGDDGAEIGAAVPCVEIGEHAELKRLYPGLVEAAELIGSTQIQSRATVGGNLCNASPAADTVPALIANDAVAVVQGGGGERLVSVDDFNTGPGTNILTPDELLVAIRIPLLEPGTADAYLRFTPRAEMDIAVVGVGARITLDEQGVCTAARVALGAAAPTAVLVPEAAEALVGKGLDEQSVAAAGEACRRAARPITDQRGPAEYRRKIAAVLCRRAIAQAGERAKKGRN